MSMSEEISFPEVEVIDLYTPLKRLWKIKIKVFLISILVGGITAVATLFLPNIYQARTTVLPVSSDSGSLNQYAGIAAMIGVDLPFNDGGTDVNKIIALLESRFLKERIITDLNLMEKLIDKVPGDVSMEFASLEEFSRLYSIKQDKKTNLISISMQHEDPALTAEVVNYVVDVLTKVLDEKNLTISSKKLLLIEKQLKDKRQELEVIKERLLDFQRRTQLLIPESQAEGVMELYSTLVQQKITLEVELQTLEAALSANNPKVKVKRQQLEAVEYQLNNISSLTLDGSFDTADVPENMAEYMEIKAEFELAQKMYLTIYAQWEQLKLQEQEERLYVEVIDKGYTPERKIKPKRLPIVIAAMFFAVAGIYMYLVLIVNREVKKKEG